MKFFAGNKILFCTAGERELTVANGLAEQYFPVLFIVIKIRNSILKYSPPEEMQ